MARYRVKATAFYNGSRVREGQIVEGPDDLAYGWLEPPDKSEPAADPLDHDGDGKAGGSPKGGNRKKSDKSEPAAE